MLALEPLRQALAAEIGGSDLQVSFREPIDIQSNRLYDVWTGSRHLIAKEYLKQDEFDIAPQREFQALRFLAPLDIAPQPILLLPQAHSIGPIVLYEFLEGKMWDRYRPDAAELAGLAGVWLELHALPIKDLWMSKGAEPAHTYLTRSQESFARYSEWIEVEFVSGRKAVDLIQSLLGKCQAVADELGDHDPPLRFCRADNRFANFIWRPDGRLGIVDWEDSGLRDPALDLVDLFTHANQEDLLSYDDWQAFYRPYMKRVGWRDPALHHRIHLHMLLHNLFWLSILINEGLRRFDAGNKVQDRGNGSGRKAAGGLAGWHVNQIPANQRLRRYLARVQAWPEMNFASQLEQLSNVDFFPA